MNQTGNGYFWVDVQMFVIQTGNKSPNRNVLGDNNSDNGQQTVINP